MNRVGEAGRGTSVWLGWFLLKALTDFIPVARSRGDKARVAKWRQHAAALKQEIETNGWDGEWYLRGTFDDGSPLGSARSDECRIDSIAQSWAVLSGEADPERAARAVDQAVARLVDDENGIVRLFDPPFHDTDKEPGYIKSYPPGVRENGGQYTHAATWLVIALARLGRADEAYRLLSMINPASRVRDREVADRYRVEPYAVAADIYAGDKAGRGGWTWYTGSSGWLYRACVEAVLGISRRGDRLHVSPVLPTSWDGYRATVRLNGTSYRVTVQRGMKPVVEVDGQPVSTGSGQHYEDQDAVTITLA
jgi:cyclic beta-1,2-glucan synthetase